MPPLRRPAAFRNVRSGPYWNEESGRREAEAWSQGAGRWARQQTAAEAAAASGQPQGGDGGSQAAFYFGELKRLAELYVGDDPRRRRLVREFLAAISADTTA